MYIIELVPIFVSFLTTLIITPYIISYLKRIGIVGTDANKKNKPKIPEMGGISVLTGFIFGVFSLIWIHVFILKKTDYLLEIFSGITTVLIIFIIGMIDDISSLKKAKKKIGLKQWLKPLLTLPASIPLVAIMAGNHTISIPFVGTVNLGILYPLFLVPIGVVGASNATNMLAGLNGLEAGLGFVLLSSLGIYSIINGNFIVGLFSIIFASSLLAFLVFNWYPARIFPGDSLTYSIGAVAAVVAILGNMEKFSVLCFTPWFIELFLKMRTKFRAESFGVIQKDGTLKPKNGIGSLTHIVMKLGRFKEYEIVSIIILFEVFVCLISFVVVTWL